MVVEKAWYIFLQDGSKSLKDGNLAESENKKHGLVQSISESPLPMERVVFFYPASIIFQKNSLHPTIESVHKCSLCPAQHFSSHLLFFSAPFPSSKIWKRSNLGNLGLLFVVSLSKQGFISSVCSVIISPQQKNVGVLFFYFGGFCFVLFWF